jgi:hypothetical protein
MSSTHAPVSDNQSAIISGTLGRPQWLDFPQVYDAPGVATAIRRWWDEETETRSYERG